MCRGTLPMKPVALLAFAVCLPLLASAEGTASSYPRLEFRSGLADYRPHREAEMTDWRAVNDMVGRLGGHMGHVQVQGTEPRRGPGSAVAQPAEDGRRQP